MRRAFTLVELLVVIAIIALLVAILLPSLGKARNLAKLTQSTANARQLMVGMGSYRTDFKDQLPMAVSGRDGFTPGVSSWSFGGKWCNVRWSTDQFAGLFDQNPAARPLNAYVYPSVAIDNQVSDHNRATLELPLFRSPGDKISYQFQARIYPSPDYSISSYDDVGTSYHVNIKWWNEVEDSMRIDPRQNRRRGETTYSFYSRILKNGMFRINTAGEVAPSRFVWVHDQTADIVANDTRARNWMGEFGDRNRSVMAFLDGHVEYVNVVPNAMRGPGYTFLLSLPRDRTPGAGG